MDMDMDMEYIICRILWLCMDRERAEYGELWCWYNMVPYGMVQ